MAPLTSAAQLISAFQRARQVFIATMEYLLPPPRPCQQWQWQLLLPLPGIILYLLMIKSKENQIAFESDVRRKVNFQTHCHRDRLFPEKSQTLSPSLHILISLLIYMQDLSVWHTVFIPSEDWIMVKCIKHLSVFVILWKWDISLSFKWWLPELWWK